MLFNVAVPRLVRVSTKLLDAPISMVPKFSAPGTTCNCAVAANPDRATDSGTCVASVARDRVPVNAPLPTGVNVTTKVQELPAANVEPAVGQEPSATLNVPFAVTEVNVIGVAEVFVTVTFDIALDPTFTDPKLMAVGFRVSGADKELPNRLMNSSESAASLCISNVPVRTVALVAFVGVNITLKLQPAPGSTASQVVVVGKSTAGSIDNTCIVVVPVFVSVTICAAEALPSAVFANVSALSLNE
jgi:hypothetical protein